MNPKADPAAGHVGRAALAAAIGLWLPLAGCQTREQMRGEELAVLAQALPGTWSSATQAESEAASGRADHPAEVLEVTRVSAPVLGRLALRVRERSAGDLRRVLSERLWIFDQADGPRLVAEVERFGEPARWAAAGAELMRSIMPQDVVALPGCRLAFTRTPAGFAADTGPAGCAVGEGGAARLVQHWRLEAGALRFAELAPGRAPGEADWYRFERLSESAP